MGKLTAETYSDAELLALYRAALADLSMAQTTILRGKTVTRATIPQIKDMIVWLESRVNQPGRSAVVYSRHGRC